VKFIDDFTKADLAKSSTILQCILSILDYECNLYHFQPEVVSVVNNVATVNLDPMKDEEIMDACLKVNRQFQRLDKSFTCVQLEHGQTFVKCTATKLGDYIQLA
jgi:hypothetical protein